MKPPSSIGRRRLVADADATVRADRHALTVHPRRQSRAEERLLAEIATLERDVQVSRAREWSPS